MNDLLVEIMAFLFGFWPVVFLVNYVTTSVVCYGKWSELMLLLKIYLGCKLF